ncbi:Multidrug transporter EmrE [compost metagenome]
MSASFYLLTHAIKVIPIGIAYAIWSAVGIVLISLVGYFVYKQTLDLPAILGIALIIIGVVIINIFSKSASH